MSLQSSVTRSSLSLLNAQLPGLSNRQRVETDAVIMLFKTHWSCYNSWHVPHHCKHENCWLEAFLWRRGRHKSDCGRARVSQKLSLPPYYPSRALANSVLWHPELLLCVACPAGCQQSVSCADEEWVSACSTLQCHPVQPTNPEISCSTFLNRKWNNHRASDKGTVMQCTVCTVQEGSELSSA